VAIRIRTILILTILHKQEKRKGFRRLIKYVIHFLYGLDVDYLLYIDYFGTVSALRFHESPIFREIIIHWLAKQYCQYCTLCGARTCGINRAYLRRNLSATSSTHKTFVIIGSRSGLAAEPPPSKRRNSGLKL